MQVFKLVLPGGPDRVLAFDGLPKDLLRDCRRGAIEGFPRYWYRWFERVVKHDFAAEPKPFYTLDYLLVNKEKEAWGRIVEYARKMSPKEFRLMDNLADMAKPLAVDSHSELTLDPEDIPVIPLTKIEVVDSSKKETKQKEKVA